MIVPIIIIIENVRSYFEFGPYNFTLSCTKVKISTNNSINHQANLVGKKINQTYCFSELSFKGKESI